MVLKAGRSGEGLRESLEETEAPQPLLSTIHGSLCPGWFNRDETRGGCHQDPLKGPCRGAPVLRVPLPHYVGGDLWGHTSHVPTTSKMKVKPNEQDFT